MKHGNAATPRTELPENATPISTAQILGIAPNVGAVSSRIV